LNTTFLIIGHTVEDEGNVAYNCHDPEIEYKNARNLRDTLAFNKEVIEN